MLQQELALVALLLPFFLCIPFGWLYTCVLALKIINRLKLILFVCSDSLRQDGAVKPARSEALLVLLWQSDRMEAPVHRMQQPPKQGSLQAQAGKLTVRKLSRPEYHSL
ncbi:MAG: hypothetical protein U9Q98_06440 [Bacteroidota bacterium]|nr:hypothetical protein [Bacteroidota bacterium]